MAWPCFLASSFSRDLKIQSSRPAGSSSVFQTHCPTFRLWLIVYWLFSSSVVCYPSGSTLVPHLADSASRAFGYTRALNSFGSTFDITLVSSLQPWSSAHQALPWSTPPNAPPALLCFFITPVPPTTLLPRGNFFLSHHFVIVFVWELFGPFVYFYASSMFPVFVSLICCHGE